jgi:gluconokinase
VIIVVMGVAGSGKTTIGQELAAALGWGFTDGDEFHGPASIAKMKSGVALTDADREPWLHAVKAAIDERKGTGHVFACSALKARYRELLGAGDPQVRFVYLRGDASLIGQRLSGRVGHFFDPALLSSQFEALEEPRDALTVDIAQTPDALVGQIIAALDLRRGGSADLGSRFTQ